MSNKRDLKAYVRYDGNGRAVPGGLILNRFKPGVGNWKETAAYECCNQTTACSFWINQIVNPEDVDSLSAIGSGIDSNNNSFLVSGNFWTNPNNPNTSSGGCGLLQKFSCDGSLLWEKAFDFSENFTTFSYIEPATLSVDKENNVIVPLLITINSPFSIYVGVTKFDNDGNQLWSMYLPIDTSVYNLNNREILFDIKYDSSNNIYLCDFFGDDVNVLVINKISPSGTLLARKYIETVTGFTNAYININSSNDLYVWGDSGSGKFYIIKLDQNLNEIWAKTFDGSLYTGGGVVFDSQENIVVHLGGYISNNSGNLPDAGSYIKISPAGSVVGTVRLSNVTDPDLYLGTLQMDSDSQGNVYISSYYPSSIPGYSAPANTFFVIAKISSTGIFEWAYALNAPEDVYLGGYYWYCSIAGKLVNDSLVLGYYDTYDPFRAQLFKLPLTPLAQGTYGDYIVTDITSLWTQSSPSVTLSDATITYNDGSTDYELLTYLGFAQTSTITNTPL